MRALTNQIADIFSPNDKYRNQMKYYIVFLLALMDQVNLCNANATERKRKCKFFAEFSFAAERL